MKGMKNVLSVCHRANNCNNIPDTARISHATFSPTGSIASFTGLVALDLVEVLDI